MRGRERDQSRPPAGQKPLRRGVPASRITTIQTYASGVCILDREESRRLLASAYVGRLIYTDTTDATLITGHRIHPADRIPNATSYSKNGASQSHPSRRRPSSPTGTEAASPGDDPTTASWRPPPPRRPVPAAHCWSRATQHPCRDGPRHRATQPRRRDPRPQQRVVAYNDAPEALPCVLGHRDQIRLRTYDS